MVKRKIARRWKLDQKILSYSMGDSILALYPAGGREPGAV
jgi:hypothetical protein